MEVGEISAVLKRWDRQAGRRENQYRYRGWLAPAKYLNRHLAHAHTYTASLKFMPSCLILVSLLFVYISISRPICLLLCFCQSVLSFFSVHSLTCPVFVLMDSTVFMDASWCFSAFCITPFSFRMCLNVSLQKWFFTNKQSHLNTLSQSESGHPVGGLEWIICLYNLDNLTATQLTSYLCLV